MGFRMIAPKRIKKVKSQGAQEALDRLEEFLKSDDVLKEPVKILCSFWKDQRTAITYKELREAVKAGTINNDTLRQWQQDYSYLVKTKLNDVWANAIRAGATNQPLVESIAAGFTFNTQSPGILSWLSQRGAEFVTLCTQQQKDAMAALLSKKMIEGHTVDELSRMIRPCIGLTETQVKANARYYDNIVRELRKEHPRMSAASIRQKALDASAKYAERQHRERAMTIAQTESAFAYNQGADEGIRQAQSQNLLSIVKKRWSTSGDDAVCDMCASLEGIEVDMDANFNIGGRLLFAGQHMLPPAHPRCACAVEYIEVSAPVDIPQMQVSITQSDSFKEYSTKEIENIARQTEEIASKYIDIPSKWSGNIIVDDERGITGKLWNCDILIVHHTAPHIILHEQIHARSISYYDTDTYIQYRNIEEASVQLVTQEISTKEGIEIVESQYNELVESLRLIGRRINAYKTDYDFSKALFEIPVIKRLDWLSDRLYSAMQLDADVTVKDYIYMSELLDMLY